MDKGLIDCLEKAKAQRPGSGAAGVKPKKQLFNFASEFLKFLFSFVQIKSKMACTG